MHHAGEPVSELLPDGSPVKHANYSILNGMRVVSSSAWGITRTNDFWHIGPGKDFPTVEYVLENPDAAVRWMARLFNAGNANLRVSYSSGAHKQWL